MFLLIKTIFSTEKRHIKSFSYRIIIIIISNLFIVDKITILALIIAVKTYIYIRLIKVNTKNKI